MTDGGPFAPTLVRMPGPPAPSVAPATRDRAGLVQKLLRYFTGSVVATLCSEVAFVLLYGVLGTGTIWSSTLSWVAGAVPNFWLNRNWAWQRTGRPSLRGEVLPYAAIVLVTLLLATLATRGAEQWLDGRGVSDSVRVALVAAVFLAVYVVVFVLRYVLLDRLFSRPQHRPGGGLDEPA
jgi:putative flippase GtrA